MLDQATLASEKLHYWRNGHVVVRGMFSPAEMAVVRQRIHAVAAMRARVDHLRALQAQGEHPSFETIFVWNDVLGDDVFAKLGRSDKLLDRLSFYYDDDVYGYHNKIVLKLPGVVGFRPHQDHAYWQGYGCRFPEAHAVYIAIDEATRSNGCLQLVPRSHLLGVLPHGAWSGRGSDNGVLPEVMQGLYADGYRLEPIEARPGDAILFHGQTIHASDDNTSEQPRLAMIATMNTRNNSPDPAKNRPGHPYWSHQPRITAPITAADLDLPLPRFDLRCEPHDAAVAVSS